MADNLTSNIIIETEVRKPNRSGFEQLLKDITDVETRLNALAAKRFDVTVRLNLDDADMRKFFSGGLNTGSAQNTVRARVARRFQVQNGQQVPVSTGNPARTQPLGGGPTSGGEDVVRVTRDAQGATKKYETEVRNVVGSQEDLLRTTTKIDKKGKETTTTLTEQVDLQRKGEAAARRTLAVEQGRREENARIRKEAELAVTASIRKGEADGFRVAGSNEKEVVLQKEFTNTVGERVVLTERINRLNAESTRSVKFFAAAQNTAKTAEEKAVDRERERIKAAKALRTERDKARDTDPDVGVNREKLLKDGYRLAATTNETLLFEKEIVNAQGQRVKRVAQLDRQTGLVTAGLKAQLGVEQQVAMQEELRERRRAARAKEISRRASDPKVEAGVELKTRQFLNSGFKVQSATDDGREVTFIQRKSSALGEQYDTIIKLDVATGRHTVKIRENTQATKDQDAAQRKQLSTMKQVADINDLLSRGFKEISPTRTVDHLRGTTDTIRRFQKVSGNAFTGLSVELSTVNTRTGVMRTEMIEGSKAIKFLGDSFATATSKVLLWTAATSTIFGAIQLISQAATNVRELEANTVLLARVGRNLTQNFVAQNQASSQSNFPQRLKEARELTRGIVDLTAQIGGSATEAQRAAAIFLRTGQTREQTLKSVRAALIASRIAELGVVEAAELLSSASAQFSIEAEGQIAVLDQLNTLSNNYKVTTDDLLQSISRTGSVVADANGRLSELAAITAVVAQNTSRTGAEIGNAIKTIQSRLDTLDVRSKLFDELGLSIEDSEGNVKSLSRVLLELKGVMGSLSPVQQRDITLSIAGVRQRNILIAAIKNADAALEAEIVALSNAGSAQLELAETSTTLDSSLARLEGSFGKLSDSLSSDFSGSLSLLVDGIAKVTEFGSALGGAPAKFAIYLGALHLARQALGGLLVQFGLAQRANNAFGFSLDRNGRLVQKFAGVIRDLRIARETVSAKQAAAAGGQAGLTTAAGLAIPTGAALEKSVRRHEAAMSRVRAATLGAGRGLTTFAGNTIAAIGPQLALAAAVTIVADEIFRAVNAAKTAAAVNAANAQTAEKEYQINEQRAKQIDIVTESIIDQLVLLQELEAQEQRTGESTKQQQKEIESQIRKRAKLQIQTRGGAQDAGDITGINFADGISREELARFEIAQQQKLLKLDEERIAKKQEEKVQLIEQQEQLKRLNSRHETLNRQIREGGVEGTLIRLTRPFGAVDDEAEIAQRRTQIQQLNLDIQEVEKTLDKLRIEKAFNATKRSEIAALRREVRFLSEDLEKLNREQPAREFAQSVSGFDELTFLNQELSESKALTDRLSEAVKKLEAESQDLGIFEEQVKRLNSELERQEKLHQKITEARRKQKAEIAERREDRAVELGESSALSRLRQKQVREDKDDFTVEREKLDLQRQLAVARVEERNARLSEITESISASSSLQEQENLGVEAAVLRKKNMEDINRLRDLEVQKAQQLFEAEAQIAEERKKAADEAARALGVLSLEDKARVAAQARFFAADPSRKVSFEEQFFGDADANRIGRQFFNDRFDDFDSAERARPRSRLVEDFMTAGLGMMRELEKRAVAIEGARKTGLATGGIVRGRGGPRDDRAGLYALSDGEAVVPASVVKRLGPGVVNDLVAGKIAGARDGKETNIAADEKRRLLAAIEKQRQLVNEVEAELIQFRVKYQSSDPLVRYKQGQLTREKAKLANAHRQFAAMDRDNRPAARTVVLQPKAKEEAPRRTPRTFNSAQYTSTFKPEPKEPAAPVETNDQVADRLFGTDGYSAPQSEAQQRLAKVQARRQAYEATDVGAAEKRQREFHRKRRERLRARGAPVAAVPTAPPARTATGASGEASEKPGEESRAYISDQDLIRGVQRRAFALDQQAAGLGGNSAVQGGGGLSDQGATGTSTTPDGRTRPVIETRISQDTFDLQPLTNEFQRIVDEVARKGYESAVSELKKYIDQRLNLPKVKPQQVATPSS